MESVPDYLGLGFAVGKKLDVGVGFLPLKGLKMLCTWKVSQNCHTFVTLIQLRFHACDQYCSVDIFVTCTSFRGDFSRSSSLTGLNLEGTEIRFGKLN